jgi:hypothetical protein
VKDEQKVIKIDSTEIESESLMDNNPDTMVDAIVLLVQLILFQGGRSFVKSQSHMIFNYFLKLKAQLILNSLLRTVVFEYKYYTE